MNCRHSCRPRALAFALWLFFIGLGAAPLLTSGCDSGQVVNVTIIPVAGVQSSGWRLTAAVSGQLLRSPPPYPASASSATLFFPGELRGRLQLEVMGLTADGCFGSEGRKVAELSGEPQLNVDIFVAPLPSEVCELAVSVRGQPGGTIESAGGELHCGERCQATVPRGTPVRLSFASATGGHFVGWAGQGADGCAGTGACEVSVQAPTQVAALVTHVGVCSSDGFCWQSPQPEGQTLHALKSFSQSDLWAAGDGGLVLHFDGSSWAGLPSGTVQGLTSIWGPAPNSVWITGEQGTILHWDGAAFGAVPSGTEAAIHAVWGSGAGDLWAVGEGGLLLHGDGTSWTPASLPTTSALRAVWGTAADDVWVVGYGDKTWHFDGRDWSEVPLGSSALLTGLWGTGRGDLWAAGYDYASQRGAVWHFDGAKWRQLYLTLPVGGASGPRLSAIAGSSQSEVWAVGEAGTLAHWDGKSWHESRRGSDWLLAVAGAGAGGLWAAGSSGALWRWDGLDWRSQRSGGGEDLGVLFSPGGSEVWMAGSAGTLLRWDGQKVAPQPSGTVDALHALWGTGPSDLWLAGAFGLLSHFDGKEWKPMPTPVGNTVELFALWGSGRDDVWAAGTGGTLLHWNGASWSAAESGVGVTLTGLWGASASDLWASGERGVIMRYDGTRWRPTYTRTLATLRAVWGSSANSVWVVGDGAQVIHWDGATLDLSTILPDSEAQLSLLGVHGRGPSAVTVVGQAGLIMHWDGTTWKRQASGTVEFLSAVLATPSGVWAVGAGGTVLRRP